MLQSAATSKIPAALDIEDARAYLEGDEVVVNMYGRPFSLDPKAARRLAWDLVQILSAEHMDKKCSAMS